MSDDYRILEPIVLHGEQCKYCGKVARSEDPEAFDDWEARHLLTCPRPGVR